MAAIGSLIGLSLRSSLSTKRYRRAWYFWFPGFIHSFVLL
jgi:hypothetical protein